MSRLTPWKPSHTLLTDDDRVRLYLILADRLSCPRQAGRSCRLIETLVVAIVDQAIFKMLENEGESND